MNRFLAFGALLGVFFLVGCARPSLVGTWVATGSRPITLTFQADGTYTASVQSEMGFSLDIGGKYVLAENRLRLTEPKIKNELPFGMGAGAGAGLDRLIPSNVQLDVAFKDNNEVVIAGNLLLDGNYKRQAEKK